MSNSPQQNSANIQAIIDSKIALLNSIVVLLAALIASPSPSYSIDGQQVSLESYQRMLMDQQKMETEAIQDLIKLQNMVLPYQLQSRVI